MTEPHSTLEPWEIISRITLYILEAVEPEALDDKLSTRSWSVGEHFAHLHRIRLSWMEQYPDIIAGLTPVPKDQTSDKEVLKQALTQSADAMTHTLQTALDQSKFKGFKRSVPAFIGYLVAHESYHHGEIGIILGQSGHRLDKDVAWGMWEWDKR